MFISRYEHELALKRLHSSRNKIAARPKLGKLASLTACEVAANRRGVPPLAAWTIDNKKLRGFGRQHRNMSKKKDERLQNVFKEK